MKILDISFRNNPIVSDEVGFFHFRDGYMGYLRLLAERHEVMHSECADVFLEGKSDGVRHLILKKKPSYFWLPLGLFRRIGRENFDWIFVHGLRSALQVLVLKFLFLNKKTKIAAIHHAEQPSSGLKKWLQKLADRRAIDRYFFASLGNAQAWLDAGIISNSLKISEIMEISSDFQPLDRGACRQKLGLPPDEKILLWVGRLHPVKDPLTVLRGFQIFLKKGNAARLCLIFQTEELLSEIESLLVSDEQLRRHVSLVGRVEHAGLETWFSAADFFVLGSRYEGSGTALAEAMACCCVPVVSDIPAFRSITGGGEAGFLFEKGNPQAFSATLEAAFSNFKNENRQRVRYFFEKKLSWRAIAEGMEEAMQKEI